MIFYLPAASESLSAHLYGPITALIIINIGFFILTTVMLCRNNRINTTSDARKDQARQKYELKFFFAYNIFLVSTKLA